MDYQQILKDIYQEIQPYASIGKQADYIPALAKINRLLHPKYFESFFTCHVFES